MPRDIINSPAVGRPTPADSSTRWLLASGMWLIAGFSFQSLTPLTALLSEGLERSLSSAAGMSGELAYYVAFTVLRIPVTAVAGTLVGAAQCVAVPEVRPLARRWIIAAAAGGCLSTLIFLPSALVATRIVGHTSGDMIRVILFVPGAGLFAGLVSFLQWRATRAKVLVPGWFVVASVVAAALGFLGALKFL